MELMRTDYYSNHLTSMAGIVNTNREKLPGTIALILVILYNVAVLTSVRERLIVLTKEDGLVEYAAVVCYLVSAAITITLFYISKSSERRYLFGFRRNVTFLFIGILFIIFAGEEVSWGQRIFNFTTPEFWSFLNRQGEMTLHNLNFWETLDTLGNQKHGIVRFFSSVAIYDYFWFALFLIIPILNKFWLKANHFFKEVDIPVINILYGLLFLLNYIVFELLEKTTIELRSVGEVKETNFALLYLAISISIIVQYRQMTIAASWQDRIEIPKSIV